MPANKRPRKKHVKRPIKLAAINIALTNQQKLEDAKIRDLSLHARMAFDQMRRGKAMEENWVSVACSLNMTQVLCEMGYGNEHIPKVSTALEAMFHVKNRALCTGSWALDADSRSAIEIALEVHDQQIELVNCRDVRLAIDEVRRRVHSKEAYIDANIDETKIEGLKV